MAMVAPCYGCQAGMHEEHTDVPGPVAEGIIGGWVCPCRGECRDKPNPQRTASVTLADEEMAAVIDFLKGYSEPTRDEERAG